ncbi:MAG: LCP family protein [Terrisporobacter othiniensis]|uniref:LCP family protein n=1 Tax=Terrisporobacter othiniensis TaxID=1577792 RepID=UPI00290F634E|nr:LCP family protein [Terrisporobacter othiniensis]MDU6983153.1 LCP family protein [Terrisporobacter othiniensis]
MSHKEKNFNLKRIIIILVLLLVTIPIITFFAIQSTTKQKKETSTAQSNANNGITNILLLGTDGRENEGSFRSDCMIIATLDMKHNSIKLTSLARDTYVDIPGVGKGKLNEAYFWGKEELLFKTIEKNFGIELYKYIQVDFDNLMNIIFELDGVTVSVEEHELDAVNALIPASYKSCTYENKGEMKLLTSTGRQKLNGYQAIAYTRIRYSDNAINRDGRQREVLMSVLRDIKNESLSSSQDLLNKLSPYYSTNITSSQVLDMAANAYSTGAIKNIKQGQFPITDDVHVKGGTYKDAGWVWLYDLNSVSVLHDFIYDDIDMKDNEYLKDDSNIKLNY